MALANSDAESSQGARPRFQRLGRGGGRRHRQRFSFEAALQGALDGGLSSEDEPPAPKLPAAAAPDAPGAEGAPGGGGDFVVHARPTKPRAEKRPRRDEAGNADKGSSRKRKADKEVLATEELAGEGGGAREGLQEEIKRKRDKALASRRAKQEAAGKENAPQESFRAQLQKAVGADEAAGDAAAAVKGKAAKRKAKPPRTRVADGDAPEKQAGKQKGEGASPDDAVRFHLRGATGGKGGGKTRSGADDESGSEAEPDENEVRVWKERLAKRADPEVEGIRTAFSIKACDPRAIRKLGVECFLGERGVHEGGKLLCDDEGKVNLHFLLGTYSEVLRARKRRLKGEPVADGGISADARKHLRWLVRVAREERLINSLELKRGRIALRRLERIQKSGHYSLELEANLADDSGAEQKADAAVHDGLSVLDVKFPERQNASMRNNSSLRRNLGSQIAVRQAEIHTKTSHDMDLDKARSILTAPKLSFDWEDKMFDDDQDVGGLDVVADLTATKGDSKRDLFRDVMRRSVSFHQAKNLSTGLPLRSSSSQSQNAAAGAAASASGSEGLQPKASAPPVPPVEADEPLVDPVASTVEAAPAAPAHEEATPTGTLAAGAPQAAEAAQASGEAAPHVMESAPSPREAAPSAGEAALAAPATPAPQEVAPSTAPAARVPEEAVPSAGEAAPPREGLSELGAGGPSMAPGLEPPKLEAELHERLDGSHLDGEGPHASLGVAACPDGAETQPWDDDVRPTAMWGATDMGEHPRNQWIEITPTMPFVPQDLPAAAKMDFEISPTAPFSPVDVAAVAPLPFEISPTAPFVPQEAPVADGGDSLQISPTVPFVPWDVPGPGAGDLFEISPTAPFVPRDVPAVATPAETPEEETRLPMAGRWLDGGASGQAESMAASAKPGKAKRGLKREASAESDGSAGAAASSGAADALANGLECELEWGLESELDRQRRQKEREWLLHKLKKQREEGRLAKRRRAEADMKRRAEQGSLGSSMSPEERETFLTLDVGGLSSQGLAVAPAAQKQRAASMSGRRLGGRAAEPFEDGDDAGAVLLGGARPGQRQRAFFLTGATPLPAC